MRQIAEKIEELVGRTPLLEVKRIEEAEDLKARLLVKLELFNPAGSVKDRTALFMIRDGEEKGLLKPGSVIIEPTSGNTGIGLAAIGGARGDLHHAGDYERGASEAVEGIWSRDRSDAGSQRNGRGD